jgi:uncharacterized protein YegP (UPF0339 family)
LKAWIDRFPDVPPLEEEKESSMTCPYNGTRGIQKEKHMAVSPYSIEYFCIRKRHRWFSLRKKAWYYFRIMSLNNNIIAHTEGYSSRREMLDTAEAMARHTGWPIRGAEWAG